MDPHHLSQHQSCHLLGGHLLIGWDEVSHLGELVYHDKDEVVVMSSLRERSYEVDTDGLPGTVGNRERDELAGRQLLADLGGRAGQTRSHILQDISIHAVPVYPL